MLLPLLFIFSACEYPYTEITSWQVNQIENEVHAADVDTGWRPYRLNTGVKAEAGRTVWLRSSVERPENMPLLFFHYSAVYGDLSVYRGRNLLFTIEKHRHDKETVRIESMLQMNMPHLMAAGEREQGYLYLKIEKQKNIPLKLNKYPVFISDKNYLRLLVFENIELISVSVILLFLAFLSIPFAVLFKAERKRYLIVAGINISGGVSLMTGNPYVWNLFKEPYAVLKGAMAALEFLPVFTVWFLLESAVKYRIVLKLLFGLHLLLASAGTAAVFINSLPANLIHDITMVAFSVSVLSMVVLIFSDLFQGDRKTRLIGVGFLIMAAFSVNDLLKSFGIFLITERPLYHWGLLSLSGIMLVFLLLEFENRRYNLQRRMSRLKELAFIGSHKLRMPLSNILGLAEQLKSEELSEKEKAGFTDMISVSAAQLDAMVFEMNRLSDEHTGSVETRTGSIKKPVKEIILIDDDSISNMLNERIVKHLYPEKKVRVFDYAPDAISHLQQRDDLNEIIIFLDINMPDMNGFEFLDAMCENYELNVFMLTSSVDKEDMRTAFSYRCVYGFITKPLKKSEVVNSISAGD